MNLFVLLFVAVAAGAPAVPTPAPLPSLPSTLFPQVTFASSHPALAWIVQTLFIVSAIGLIGLMAVQTTKNEGLSGTIGGRSESAYHGRLGLDQQLARLTSGLAIAFVIFAILYFLVSR